jgi:aminoglycoside phosphotransferase family enzyme/predicted kinase
MDIQQLIDGLSRPDAYPHPVDAIEVRQTHISVVFLAGDFVYKLHKPVRLGFLDFSTPELRKHDCEEEVRLNRRLAPDVYLGVVGVEATAGGLRFREQPTKAIEWAVKMRRLPDNASVLERLRRGELTGDQIDRLAEVVAAFHRDAATDGKVASFGRLDVVARNARENFTQSESEVGETVSRAVFERLRDLTESAITQVGPLVEDRAARGIPRDTHGDLHLDHVYLFPDRPPPGDVVIIDCVEFSERLRYADPTADMAFLVMDLKFRGRRDLAGRFADAYFAAADDPEGRRLLPFYTAYRAAVRGKVEGMTVREPEVAPADRERFRRLARGHWLLALGELAPCGERPALLLVAGLPGAGKSTLARGLTPAGFEVIRSDEVRKRLYPATTAADPEQGSYSTRASDAVYAECRRLAETALWEGRRVIVDANFREEARRGSFLDLASELAVPACLIVCRAEPEVIRQRLAARSTDVSDADWAVYQWAAARWQDPDADWVGRSITVDTTTGVAAAIEAVQARLRADGLA